MEMTINYFEIEMTCIFDIDQHVEAVYYGDNAHPEEGGNIYNLEIFIGDINIMEILSEKQIDIITDLIYEKL